jgi:hypothetical protein
MLDGPLRFQLLPVFAGASLLSAQLARTNAPLRWELPISR